MSTIDLKIRILEADLPRVRSEAARLGVSMSGLVRRKLRLGEPPPKGGPGRGQGRKKKET